MKPMDARLRQYYEGQSLSEDKVEALLRQRAEYSRRRVWRRVLTAAALLALVCAGLFRYGGSESAEERVLAEIATNHRKDLGSEVTSESYQVVQQGLERLDFPILPARAELLRNYALVGGRYCSLQSELAAQLKVRDRVTGEVLTLYVARLSEALAGIAPLDAERGGVHMRLWVDGGRLFALAGSKE